MKNKKAMTMLTVFALCCGLVCCLTGGETIYGTDEESIISMSKGSCNVSARDILTKGTVSFDENAGFNRDGHILDANIVASGVDGAEYDGQFFAHFGAGYTMKITVDFGTNQVDRLTFRSFGTNETPTVFEVYAGETLLGTGSTGACGNGWLDNEPGIISEQALKGEILFDEVISGQQNITLKVISSASAWPANTIGCLTFHAQTVDTGDAMAWSVFLIVFLSALSVIRRKIKIQE